jgi:hypothetical protein
MGASKGINWAAVEKPLKNLIALKQIINNRRRQENFFKRITSLSVPRSGLDAVARYGSVLKRRRPHYRRLAGN